MRAPSAHRIFASPDFRPQSFGPSRWLEEGKAYTTLERSRDRTTGQDLVRYYVATGERTLLVPAERLIPTGDTLPLTVDQYTWSKDQEKLLIFTNTEPVWRLNTRGDYYSLDLAGGKLKKLGGRRAKPSTLMFAKYSPDGRKVGYVRENNLYVEDLATGLITQLARDGSGTMINGTFDWVYEEELMAGVGRKREGRQGDKPAPRIGYSGEHQRAVDRRTLLQVGIGF